ncbi:hypothetical protein [uncultured Arenimonas sp.]|uniref:hypothetical protein n=1 Tax=uncultured Arenimonas sp. TaxID=546226 RepID=UPI0030D8B355
MSGNNLCLSTYTDPALTYFDLGAATFLPFATSAFAQAQEQIDRVVDFEVPIQQWEASFDASGDLTPYVRPPKPTLLEITVPPTPVVPAAPTLNLPALTVGPAPVEPPELSNIPVFVRPPKPDPLDAERPGPAPTIESPDMPVAPVLVEPDAPELEVIELPTVPDIAIERFDELAPTFDAPVPSELVDFQEDPYASAFLDKLKGTLSTMLDGGFYLPEAVSSAIWGGAVQREDQSELKLLQESRELHSNRGFDEPDGNLESRMLEAMYANRAQRGQLNREVYVRSETVAIENLGRAIASGLTLESTLLQAHLTVQERQFQMAFKVKDLALAVFQARVAQFNGAIQAYNARVDAYRAYLDGLRAEVDVYRAEVEAAKVRGDINEQRVRMYAERIRAQLARAEAYRAQVEGVKAFIEAERAKIEGYRAEVEAYGSLVDAKNSEWDAYRTQIMADAEQGKVYETLARVYGTRVEAHRTGAQIQISQQDSHIKAAEAELRRHDNMLRALLAQLENARTVIAAQTAHNESAARIYTAEAAIEQAVSDSNTRGFQAETERSRVRSDTIVQNVRLAVEQILGVKGLMLEALKSGAQASSQLAASSFSALSFGASISSSQSRTKACSTNFSYVGEIADAVGAS